MAALIGISQQAVSDLLRRGVIAEGDTLGRWLKDYCSHIREVAAGRDSQLSVERTRLAAEQADRIAMQNAIARKEYAPVALIESVLAKVGRQIAGILETIPVQLKRRTDVSQQQLDLITSEIIKARNLAADIRIQDEDRDDGNALESGDTERDHEWSDVA